APHRPARHKAARPALRPLPVAAIHTPYQGVTPPGPAGWRLNLAFASCAARRARHGARPARIPAPRSATRGSGAAHLPRDHENGPLRPAALLDGAAATNSARTP